MARENYLFTSESVAEGHPDKVCDRISDEIVDLFFREGAKAGVDPYQIRVAAETLATTNRVIIAGEVRGPAIPRRGHRGRRRAPPSRTSAMSRRASIGATPRSRSCCTHNPPTSRRGWTPPGNKDEGAGDQGIMFGYACRETPEFMPAPIYYAHKILEVLARERKSGKGDAAKLGPDAKSQVTVRYRNGKPVGVTQIVLSTQHLDENLSSDDVRAIVEPYIRATLPEGWIGPDTVWHVNPTGKFVIGGPDGDTGLTGRKIIVDTYGGAAPHGGGAFSGKDPTKVDRSAAYAARYLAKNVVAAGLADRCHHPVVLRHRRRRAALDLCRHAWHRQGGRGQDRGALWRAACACRRAASASI